VRQARSVIRLPLPSWHTVLGCFYLTVPGHCLNRQAPAATSGERYPSTHLYTRRSWCLTLQTPLGERVAACRASPEPVREPSTVHPEPSSAPTGRSSDNKTFGFSTPVQTAVSGQSYHCCGPFDPYNLQRSRQSTNTSLMLSPCETSDSDLGSEQEASRPSSQVSEYAFSIVSCDLTNTVSHILLIPDPSERSLHKGCHS
jgi:hypothetical protein